MKSRCWQCAIEVYNQQKKVNFHFHYFSILSSFFLLANVIEREYFHTVNESCAVFNPFLSLFNPSSSMCAVHLEMCNCNCRTTWFFHPIHVAPLFKAVWGFAAQEFPVVYGVELPSFNELGKVIFLSDSPNILRLYDFWIETNFVANGSWKCFMNLSKTANSLQASTRPRWLLTRKSHQTSNSLLCLLSLYYTRFITSSFCINLSFPTSFSFLFQSRLKQQKRRRCNLEFLKERAKTEGKKKTFCKCNELS